MDNKNGMDFSLASIRSVIEEKLESGYTRFAIFPYGDVGIKAKSFLNSAYGIAEEIIIDNHLSKYNPQIKPIGVLNEVDRKGLAIILATTNGKIYSELKKQLTNYLDELQIADVYEKFYNMCCNSKQTKYGTKCGKYSYGPLTDHLLVEEVGAFCGFAPGTDVVSNHAVDYISIHPMIYYDKKLNPVLKKYEDSEKALWYFSGVQPKGLVRNLKKIHIGNDVWLGKNVLITNSANIGNGVIAGAGAVITKDVPDYAVVVGVPARIIRFRYTSEEIDALNKIAWWEWSDEEIRERFDDFYLPVEEFIKKYL